ncbi:MAG: tetratricopeptide repeat protein [Candidatus Eisenbacteria bacterium]|nr:tetratricopeptide repeat protein [Candidatus Eisenbacteria bacterium]
MPNRLIVQEQAGRIRVFLHRKGQVSPEQFGTELSFSSPLTQENLEDLRWYLEEYLRAPFAVWENRGLAIQTELRRWGEQLFEAVFGTGKPGRDAYVQARESRRFDLWLQSSSPAFLGLPWELLHDPERPTAVALSPAGINRTIPTPGEKAAEIRRGDRLQVLMVIARPYATRDVPYQMIARPLLELLRAISGQVSLEVLRPPTFEALRARLREVKENGDPFDIFHFDGHGTFGEVLGGRAQLDPWRYRSPEGYLVFEKESGEPDPVSATDFATLMKDAEIPLLIFNACRSGTVVSGVGPEATVATRLLQEGAGAVVAMGYSVYAVAAAEFMALFYEALFAGYSVSQAVIEGRCELHRRALRPSPRGLMPLEDWIVPVHYARREISFPQLKRTAVEGKASLAKTLEQVQQRDKHSALAGETSAEDPLAAAETFVGRDAEFYELERALRNKRVVVIHGVGGTGKTELAKAFARWLQASGGLEDPGLVFWYSFEPGLASCNLEGVITSLGLRLFGPDFVRIFPKHEARRGAILEVLLGHRLLIIWDNFETTRSMPDLTRGTPPLDEKEQAEVQTFLAEVVRDSRSGILITSRSSEEWLGEKIHRLELGGLSPQDAAEYADQLLAPYPKAQERRKARAYGTLLELLGGHPLSMRLILSRLNEEDAQTLVDALRGEGDLLHELDAGEGRLESLGACISYSFRQLAEGHRRHLPALALFEGVVDADALAVLSKQEGVPERFRRLAKKTWDETLQACVGAGLLSKIGGGMYRIHPALPAYLVALWRKEAGEAFDAEFDGAHLASIKAHAILGAWLDEQIAGGSAETAMMVLALERRTFCAFAFEALERELFSEAQYILQPLAEFWDARGLFEEAREWVDRCRLVLEDAQGNPPDLDTPEGALWLFVVGSQASRLMLGGDLDAAERAYDSIQRMLEGSDSESARLRLAITYHQLGIVAQDRVDLDAAEEWYRKSLEISEALGNRPTMAINYHQLGMVAQHRGDLDAAEEWYRKSLEIDKALGHRPGMASSYHQLGMVAQHRGDLDAAEEWYRKSLEIKKALGNRPGMAINYHQLGIVAQYRGDLDAAEEWYRKSLEIEEALGNRPGMAMSYGQLGMLAQRRGRDTEALDWIVRCVSLFDEFPHPSTKPGPEYLARLTNRLGIKALEESWLHCTGKPLPEKIRKAVRHPS